MFVVVQFITYVCPSCVRIKIQYEQKNFRLYSLSLVVVYANFFKDFVSLRCCDKSTNNDYTVGIMHIHREKTKLIVNRL